MRIVDGSLRAGLIHAARQDYPGMALLHLRFNLERCRNSGISPEIPNRINYWYSSGKSINSTNSPRVTDHRVTNRRVTDCRVTDHRVTDHRVTDHRVTDYRVADYRVTDCKVANYRVTDCKVADYRVANYRVANYRVADYRVCPISSQ